MKKVSVVKCRKLWATQLFQSGTYVPGQKQMQQIDSRPRAISIYVSDTQYGFENA